MAETAGTEFKDALQARVTETLDACTRCGKCVEACPMAGVSCMINGWPCVVGGHENGGCYIFRRLANRINTSLRPTQGSLAEFRAQGKIAGIPGKTVKRRSTTRSVWMKET